MSSMYVVCVCWIDVINLINCCLIPYCHVSNQHSRPSTPLLNHSAVKVKFTPCFNLLKVILISQREVVASSCSSAIMSYLECDKRTQITVSVAIDRAPIARSIWEYNQCLLFSIEWQSPDGVELIKRPT